MMTRRTESDEVLVAPEIPSDLLIEILKRLPVKSLARFKCVSKFWSSLIHSQGYLFHSPPRLYISLEQAPEKYALLSLASTSKSTAFNLDMMMDGIEGYLIAALRGLILYYFCGHACIYNPTTGQRVILPHVINILLEKEYMWQRDYFLGYDPVLDQYKLVFTALVWSKKLQRSYAKHWVFVLEDGSFWKRRIEFDHPHFPMSRGLCINGVIYYLAYTYSDVCRCIVISFDVRYEEFNMIRFPHLSEYGHISYLGIIEYGGKPTIFDYIHVRDSLVNLWVLEDAGNWSKKSLVLKSCQRHFFPNNIPFVVTDTTQKGEVVLKPKKMYSPYYILYYDLHKNDLRRVDIRGISEEPSNLALLDSGENIMHLKI